MVNCFTNRGQGGNQGNAAGAMASGGGVGVSTRPPGCGLFVGATDVETYTGGTGGTFSAGLILGNILRGDASGFSGSLDFSGAVSSSAQMADDISGSFATGMEFTNNSVISASVVTSQDSKEPDKKGAILSCEVTTLALITELLVNSIPVAKLPLISSAI
jgi:hypothetical protein